MVSDGVNRLLTPGKSTHDGIEFTRDAADPAVGGEPPQLCVVDFDTRVAVGIAATALAVVLVALCGVNDDGSRTPSARFSVSCHVLFSSPRFVTVVCKHMVRWETSPVER